MAAQIAEYRETSTADTMEQRYEELVYDNAAFLTHKFAKKPDELVAFLKGKGANTHHLRNLRHVHGQALTTKCIDAKWRGEVCRGFANVDMGVYEEVKTCLRPIHAASI